MKILLLSNYVNDRQESMLRFADMLDRGLRQRGHEVCRVFPKPIFGALKPSPHGAGKWLGYVDKFVFFPRVLRKLSRWAEVVHICDHSNAFYTEQINATRTPAIITCHDLLAVRGALGEDTDCPASRAGKVLQRWILSGLQQACAVACVSDYTRRDVQRLIVNGPRVRVVPNGLNHNYHLLNMREADARLARAQFKPQHPYVLHVGSSQRRKNREGVIRIFNRIKHDWNGKLVFAGQALTTEQTNLVSELELTGRVEQIINPNNDLLEALYNRAHALIFPSRFEGFGWPILEAQACGCPVICSNACSFPEVGGDGAMFRNVDDEDGFAADILQLCDRVERNEWIELGLKNIRRFAADQMIDQYVQLYEEELTARS